MGTEAPRRESVSLPVIILCGGQGTRMQSTTATKKELVEVGGRPMLWHVMKIYAAYGHTHFVLALGHQADTIKRYFLEYQAMGRDFTIRLGRSGGITYHQDAPEEDWEVTLADTGLHTLKGSRIRRSTCYVDAGTFFVTYGDGVGNVDINALLDFHRGHGKLATVTGVRPRSQYGVLRVNESHQVLEFGEKPQMEDWINAGFMVFERGVLDYLGDGDSVDLEKDALARLAEDGQLVMYRHTGFWRSMDTFKEALELDTIWRESAPWKVW